MIDDKSLCRIRTITAFISLNRDMATWKDAIGDAAETCNDLADRLRAAGYVTQSIRIVTNPFGDYLDLSSPDTARAGLESVRGILEESPGNLRVRFAIGEARNIREIEILPGLIREFGDICNACVNIGGGDYYLAEDELLAVAAETVKRIARDTPNGEGNFNFTVNFNCAPFIPYFPAGYHRGDEANAVVLGLETPDLLAAAIRNLPETPHRSARLRPAFEAMKTALQPHIDEIVRIMQSTPSNFRFAGIDSSAAPSFRCASMVDIYRLLGVQQFGGAGTLEISSLLTAVFKSIQGVPLVGFSGLMLAVTEDRGLAEAADRGHIDLTSLLANSAVCGIGLDTVPIPGDTTADQIIAVMRDVATMAFRLNKPLTVRLFPVPGKQAGERTEFGSGDLCNCAILEVR